MSSNNNYVQLKRIALKDNIDAWIELLQREKIMNATIIKPDKFIVLDGEFEVRLH